MNIIALTIMSFKIKIDLSPYFFVIWELKDIVLIRNNSIDVIEKGKTWPMAIDIG